LISIPDRLLCVGLIREAVASGSRLHCACNELAICVRTFQRWVRDGDTAIVADRRTTNVRLEPLNKINAEEIAHIIDVLNTEEFASYPPSQVVPTLADRGEYLASESTLCRILKAHKMQNHRGRAKQPSTRVVTSHCATGPNQVWSWDITWLPAEIKGKYY